MVLFTILRVLQRLTELSLDTFSLADKASFAKSKAMAGCFTWSLDQVSIGVRLFPSLCLFDRQDDGVTLQNAIRTALGK